jgi:naphtho-gamma-pyrone polyketide synthase
LYPQSEDSCLVGLNTGALAAAAVSSCRTLPELVPAAVHSVVIAFRTGLCAFNVGKLIEQASEKSSASWSMVVSELAFETASGIVKSFSERLVGLILFPASNSNG